MQPIRLPFLYGNFLIWCGAPGINTFAILIGQHRPLNLSGNVRPVSRSRTSMQSRTSKVSSSCPKVSGSWRRLARRYGLQLASLVCLSNPGCRSTSFWVLFNDFLRAWHRLTSTVTSVDMVTAELTYEWTRHIIVYVNHLLNWNIFQQQQLLLLHHTYSSYNTNCWKKVKEVQYLSCLPL